MEENTTKELPTVRSVGIKYGLISALVSIVFFLILVLTGANAFDNKWNWIGLIFSIVILVLAQKNFKDDGNGFMSYGQGVGIGFWVALISVLIGGVFTYVYSNIIDPATMDTFYQAQQQQMEDRNMPDDQIEVAVEWTKKLFWPMYAFFGVFFGVLLALIVTIFTQKKSPEPGF
ncbi:MAG: DUF4199 domain-containing protein [Cyclobacteriaceae bacterium]|nr:DUF4199 domain-containing protein [Cyclobacteriaceae bacterium]